MFRKLWLTYDYLQDNMNLSQLHQRGFTGSYKRFGDCVVVVEAWRYELSYSRRAPGYFTLIGDKTPPAARDISEVARA